MIVQSPGSRNVYTMGPYIAPLQGKQGGLRRSRDGTQRVEISTVTGADDGNEEVTSFKYC